MKIYVVGSSKNKFLPLDNIREKFLIDKPHEGDNIDFLNPWYCELTGLYYLWKHVNDDIVGLEHYRRCFVNANDEQIDENKVNIILSTHDIILNRYDFAEKDHMYKWNLKQNRMPEFKKLFTIIKMYDPKLADYCLEYQKTHNYCYEGNMFICRKKVIDEYCEFIFDILDLYIKGEKHFNKALIPRICGYLAEYIFGAWCEYKQLKIYSARRRLYDRNLTRYTLGK